ncbi:MarR family winged helix-turn-helix transcriptional regulator [uncultured Lacinutrix sp.]|uniref:MarR family winged helix-turn-helix transcriptional regulator n=1 Tax=uncultured Lacinutrix sp. TaxID=574032 RepID=UPI00262ECE11|nr:MarR family winged helix-turn-helix transcriptional regulator [uncultured Lacinutrix sp.]
MKTINEFPNIQSCNPRSCISMKMMKCNRIVSNVFRKYLKPFGITNSQLSTLFVITKANNPTQKLLSQMLYMDKSSVNRNLKRLIDNGYVAKLNIHDLQTTIKGKELLEQVIPHWEKAMKDIREELEDEGELALNMVLQKLT